MFYLDISVTCTATDSHDNTEIGRASWTERVLKTGLFRVGAD